MRPEYLKYLESRFQLDPIVFDFAEMTMDTQEQGVPANRFLPNFRVTRDHTTNNRTFFTSRFLEIPNFFGAVLLNQDQERMKNNLEVTARWLSEDVAKFQSKIENPDLIKNYAPRLEANTSLFLA